VVSNSKDSTPTERGRSLGRRRLVALVGVAALLLAGLSAPAAARADGDPASDVLASQPLFLSQDAGVPPRGQAELAALLAAAQRRGYRLRAAVIASASDLGSVTELWRQPATYARFLGQELSLVAPGPLLVVMPNGYGVDDVTPAAARAVDALTAPGSRLGPATLSAVQRLAAAAGHPLPAPVLTAGGGVSSAATVPWLVFALGGAAIAAAWAASLRARPPQLGLRARGGR